jgi:HD superfamily phosphohydrolase
MLYDDVVYGEVDIDEPVILEIMTSPYMQRLK